MTKVIITSIIIAVLGFLPLMGMPGVLMLMLTKPLVRILYGPMAFESFGHSLGDGTWPLMIMLSVLWPISIPVAYILSQKLFGPLPFFSIGHLIPFCIFMVIGASLISFLVVMMNPSMKRLSDVEILEQATRVGKLSLVKKHWKIAENDQYAFGDPLQVALENKQTVVANYFLDNGVSPHEYHQDQKLYEPGLTPLHTATRNEMTEMIEKLLTIGVDPNIRSTNGKVPLHLLGMEKESLAVIEILKKYNADFTAVDKVGNTALITIAMIRAPLLKERPGLAQKLIDYGCPRDFKNNEGETALNIVKKQQPYERALIRVLGGTVE